MAEQKNEPENIPIKEVASLPASGSKSIQNQIEYRVYKALRFLVKATPKRLIPFLGRLLGRSFYTLRIRRNVVLKNLEIAFGETHSYKELKTICRRTYANYGIVLLEVLLLDAIPVDKIGDYIAIEGLDILQQAVDSNQSVVIAGNHMGNWELFSAGLSSLGSPFHLYVGKQRNRLFDNSLNSIRERFGVSTIGKSKTASIQMLKILKKKGVLAMAGDLNVPADKLFVDFFGKKAAIGRGIPTFVVSQNAILLFIWTVRVGPLKHKGYIKEIKYNLSGNLTEKSQHIAQLMSDELEDKVRRFPDQYFWLNKRWKTRPVEEKDEDAALY